MPRTQTADTTTDLTPSHPLVWLMTIACGVSISGVYYMQPLLDLLARSMQLTSATASLIVTATQIGFVCGLLCLVPLGDFHNHRRLVPVVNCGGALSLAGVALAPGWVSLLIASFFVGVTATAVQIMVPLAARLAAPTQQGAVIGRVMSGLLIGILLARAFAGIVADWAGWRAVFGFAAIALGAQTVVLYRALPDTEAAGESIHYGRIWHSILALVVKEPLLRHRMVYGALGFAAFIMLWTELPFLLASPPYEYSETTIGLFSVLGAAGAIGASSAGRFYDQGYGHLATAGFMAAAVAAFVLMGLDATSLIAIVIGILLMDFGIQGVHILNQNVIYALQPEARSRITTAYMASLFLGGALGAALAGFAYARFGWPGPMGLAAGLEGTALAFCYTKRMRG